MADNKFQDKSKCVRFGRQDRFGISRIILKEKLIRVIPEKSHIFVGKSDKFFLE
jgi:hypothetical protein